MRKRYTEKQKKDFKERFIQTRRYQIALAVPVFGPLLLLLAGKRAVADLGLQPMLLGTALLLAVAAGFSWLNWRCPACRKHLGWTLNPPCCPRCRVEFSS
ncbi:MAG: hypothetical protein JRG76_13090 [Deltaproteobacteria bacterium]|nr:hypothetical protein [Deltaproteobacteria bacterium]